MEFSEKKCQAVILAGGLGTRLKPVTETIPKPMIDINGKPFLEYLLGHLKKQGVTEIVLCVGYLGNKIQEYFGDGKKFGMNIRYSYEKELLGTAGAIKNAYHLIIEDNFIVMNGDSFSSVDIDHLLEFHNNHNFPLTMTTASATNPKEQELVEISSGRITQFYKRDTPEHREHIQKTSFPLINAGVYVFNREILDLIPFGIKVSLEQEIFPKLINQIGGFQYNGYFKDIANLQFCEEFRQHLKEKKKKVLITGAGGMVGSHIADFLIEKGCEVLGVDFTPTTDMSLFNKKAIYKECDIRDRNKLTNILNWFKPDIIFHLAAQSYPTVSWERPEYTIQTNILGTVNLFEAVKELKLNSIILNAGSSAEYGYVEEKDVPVKESHELKPLHPYGVSKVAQELLAYQYHKNLGIKSVTIRIFNTTGPKKVNDVCSDFTKQIVLMEKGLQDSSLRVGNIHTRRAITDVRDLIEAFWLAIDKCDFGEAYNVSGEKVYLIRDIIEILKELTSVNFEIYEDSALMRPTDEPIIYGDSSRFKEKTGWSQKIDIRKTLKDMLDYWRKSL